MDALVEIAERVVNDAASGDAVEVYVSRGTETDVQAYDGEIEKFANAASAGLGIRILRDGPGGAQIGAAWAGSLEEDAIREALREARDNVEFASEDEYLTFARPDGVAPVSLDVRDRHFDETPTQAKVEMALALEARVRAADSRIRQVDAANYSDYVAEAAIVSSFGIRAAYERSGAFLSVEAIASADGDDQTGWGLSVGRGPSDLDLDVAATDAVRRATSMLGAIKPASFRGPVVFDPRTAATLVSIIGGALSGEAVVRGRSFFADRVGEQVASSLFTLNDDPTDPRHYAASRFDGEGLACRRNTLITEGVLRGFLYDTVSARRAGAQSTGSALRGGVGGSPSAGPRALALSPGSHSREEILRAIGEGLWVESLMGVHSGVNPISGDFSVGVTGRMIRDGQLAEPVREITVASTLQRMLLDVTHVGNDMEWLPGLSAGQTLALAELAISGR